MLGVSIGLVKKLINASFGSILVDGTQIASNAVTASHIASNAVGASEIASNAVGASELKFTFGSEGVWSTTSNTITIPAGLYQVAGGSFEVYVSGGWRGGGDNGTLLSNGSNVRMGTYAGTAYYRKLA